MTIADWLLLVARWLHLLAAVAWVGGSILFLTVLRPALSGASGEATLSGLAGREFRNLVDVAITILLFTGVILSVNRLTSGHATVAYGVVLGLKIALAVGMFYLVWFRGRRRTSGAGEAEPGGGRVPRTFTANNLLLALGIAVLFLADLLGTLFEAALLGS
ncbi:MAG: urate hydroxylase PuuD [Chloroflexi bacterium]|nr:urate hydroxylase PuuD [Chloroflexota bacterium]